ncbi:hypothetical protein CEUSTIGMA_g1524.t1 [Chlamydomonas eustigma]|uniref:Uncharacterized protein n=1 Tax=Chlamydomonas eustigma TaxID=1157962 RepID=A0A250WTB8_9CHLO|nr:hypothetical protein CEUSTIGMA_g1524.t1 [Chlamydomonas eustigma]|eukprot:GAX74074.1 hypothetical protein CEUSTIGMA_g1524.t1 [Chlamydomonas eustigma]
MIKIQETYNRVDEETDNSSHQGKCGDENQFWPSTPRPILEQLNEKLIPQYHLKCSHPECVSKLRIQCGRVENSKTRANISLTSSLYNRFILLSVGGILHAYTTNKDLRKALKKFQNFQQLFCINSWIRKDKSSRTCGAGARAQGLWPCNVYDEADATAASDIQELLAGDCTKEQGASQQKG